MRIVLDMQGAQTESRFRGIGRYTMSFARAVARNRGEHEIILALSGLFPDTIEPIRAAFAGLLPQENIRVWHAPGPVKEEQPGNKSRREVAELLREAFIASLRADVVHISSLFEGYGDEAVTSVGKFDHLTPVSVSLYDLIPLLNPDQYLQPNPNYADYYARKIEWLRNAKSLLAISAYTRQEGLDCLGFDPEKFVNVSTSIGPEFQPLLVSKDVSSSLCSSLNLERPFVLYTGGADERKNLPRLIEAWSALPTSLRQTHQLLLAGQMPEGNVAELRRIARRCGLRDGELVFSGYVGDDKLAQFYNLCKLFVFPSWHEGFGLPALEAMACGAPVIGANTTSLPEVIGLEEALFDPMDTLAIREKMQAALTDEAFRARLRAHGIVQARLFSWDATAQRAIAAWNQVVKRTERVKAMCPNLIQSLAGKLGAHDEPQLARLAANIAQNEGAGIERQLLLDISELCRRDSATGVQRVVRSYLHHLLRAPPTGFSVLLVYATQTDGYCYAHAYTAKILGQTVPKSADPPIRWQRGDVFFALDMQHHMQLAHASTYARMRRDGVVVKFLVYDLLPIQLADYFKDNGAKELHEQWLRMIAKQDEAICISKATADAYEDWIAAERIETAPGFRTDWVHMGADLDGSKPSLGLPSDASYTLHALELRPTFLAVSTLEPRKAQAQILDAVERLWAAGWDVNLLLVGQQGWKIDELVGRIRNHPEIGKRLFWLKGISDEYLGRVYQASTCLVAASINEGFGLPLIEAACHGIPIIARDIPVFREVAGESAFYFNGETGSDLAAAMEQWLKGHREGTAPLPIRMRWQTWEQSTEQLKAALIGRHYPRKQLLVDISELVHHDARTGIQRVVRSVLKEWLENPPDGYRVAPVYATVEQGYKYARRFSLRFLGSPAESLHDEPIDYAPGDIFLGLDLQPQVVPAQRHCYQELRRNGVRVLFVVYDMLCVKIPRYFVPGASEGFTRWLDVVTENDGAVCISKSTAVELNEWFKANGPERCRPFQIDWFHLGVESGDSVTNGGHLANNGGRLANEDFVLTHLRRRFSFLMVGTIEPRKGHEQVLEAFEALWNDGMDVNLVIVGKQGWMIENLVERIRSHTELGHRLFWLDGICDEDLEKVYANSNCLIAASYGEGFGLPLIEGAQHGLPVIARDIPVFREVAGEHAYYFDGQEAQELATAVTEWLSLHAQGMAPRSDGMPRLTWRESARQLLLRVAPDLGNDSAPESAGTPASESSRDEDRAKRAPQTVS